MNTSLHVLPHTHWDREWFVPSGFTREWLVPFFTALFARFDNDPDYRFTLDGQSILIEDYVAQLPPVRARETLARISQLVHERRLTVGPYYQQPDWQLVSGEALLRNLLLGIDDTSALGASAPVGWLMDNFGQISQCVQIHQQFGIEAIFAWRGFDLLPDDVRSELRWSAPDGSQLPVIYLVDSYRNGMRLYSHPALLPSRLVEARRRISPFAHDTHLLLMNGYDQEMEPELPDRTIVPADSTLRVSSPQEYVAAKAPVFSSAAVPEVQGMQYSGRFISIFPGILSARVYLKTVNSQVQAMQERYLEPLSLLAGGDAHVYEELELLWRLILQNHPHDTMCGVSSDPIHEEAEIRFSQIHERQERLLTRLTEAALQASLSEDGLPVYFNPSLYPQRPILADGMGPELPPLTVMTANNPAGDDRSGAHPEPSRVQVTPTADALYLENDSLAATLYRDGTITISGSGGTYRLTWRDVGDAGDTYNFDLPENEQPHAVHLSGGELAVEIAASNRIVVSVSGSFSLPMELSADRRQRTATLIDNPAVIRVELRATDDQAYLGMELTHYSRDHRLQMVTSPTSQDDTSPEPPRVQLLNQFHWDDATEVMNSFTAYQESDIPAAVSNLMLGAREPGLPVSLPTDRGFLATHTAGQVLVLHRGPHELEILPQGAVALTVVRAVGWLARTDLRSRTGDAGPEIFTPEAQCRRRLSFSWAIAPLSSHVKVTDHEMFRKIDRFFAPPLYLGRSAISVTRPILPWIALPSEVGVGLSACKRSEDGLRPIVRLFNPGDTPATVRFQDPVQPLTAGEHPTQGSSATDQVIGAAKIATFGLSPFSGMLEAEPPEARRAGDPERRFRYALEQRYPDCSFQETIYRLDSGAGARITGSHHAPPETRSSGAWTHYLSRTLQQEYDRREQRTTELAAAREAAREAAAQAEAVQAEAARHHDNGEPRPSRDVILTAARVSTVHRQLLEVELSILFTRRHLGLEPDVEHLRRKIRELALQLNHARVAKRTHDYHVALVDSPHP